MARQEQMYIPTSFGDFFEELFGARESYHYEGPKSLTRWRKDLKKVAMCIGKAITLNVQSDSLHRGQLLKACDDLIQGLKDGKTLAEINADAIESFARIAFLLLGKMPDRRSSVFPFERASLVLSSHRTVQYRQTDEQKVRLLIDVADRRKMTVNRAGHKTFHDAFIFDFRNDACAFLAWFKKEYQSVYCEVF